MAHLLVVVTTASAREGIPALNPTVPVDSQCSLRASGPEFVPCRFALQTDDRACQQCCDQANYAESGMAQDALSGVVQGLATGIGFLGAGAILKLEDERRILGLTTAAGVWITEAVAVAIGLGRLGAAAIGMVFAWIVLAVLIRLEDTIDRSSTSS